MQQKFLQILSRQVELRKNHQCASAYVDIKTVFESSQTDATVAAQLERIEHSERPGAVEERRLTGEVQLCPPPDLFLLEDANAIQCAVEWVLRRILDGSLEHRRAALLLHGLQIASANLKLTNFRPLPSEMIKAAPAERRGEEGDAVK